MTKFAWIRNGKDLRAVGKSGAVINYSNPGLDWITEEDMVLVAEWCEQTGCGRRTSFDTFRCKHRQDITAFLLRWA